MQLKKWAPFLVIAFLGFSALPASAQNGSATAAQDSSKTATERTEISYEAMLDALGNVVARVKDYNAVEGKKLENIQLVDVCSLKTSDPKLYQDARARYVKFVEYLQNVSGKVQLLNTAVTDAKVEATDVVAMDVLKDGKVVVYYDTRDIDAISGDDSASAADTTAKSSTTPSSN